MKKKFVLLIACAIAFLSIQAQPYFAEEHGITSKGTIEMKGRLPKNPVDPEHPETPVDPGPGPSTDGLLRFDFAPKLKFGHNKITKTDRKFYANAQLFHDGTQARGNYIQVTDSRPGIKGWELQVRQEQQFTTLEAAKSTEKELKGASLSFDNIWANSMTSSLDTAPEISKDTIMIDKQATTFPLATAQSGQGKGQWVIVFGASSNNPQNQKVTLEPKVDEFGTPVLDSEFENQQVYDNHSIFLTVPNETTIQAVQYQTELTWVLAELP